MKFSEVGGAAEIGEGAAYNQTYRVNASGEDADSFKLWLTSRKTGAAHSGTDPVFSTISRAVLEDFMEGTGPLRLNFSGNDASKGIGSVGYVELNVSNRIERPRVAQNK